MRQLTTLATLLGALAATLAPAALGAAGQQGAADDRPGAHGIGPTTVVSVSPDDRRVPRAIGSATVSTGVDDRTFVRGTGPSPVSLGPDDRVGARGDFTLSVEPRPDQIVAAPDGFDWRDAGIGLAVGLILALAVGTVVTFGRTRQTARAPLDGGTANSTG